MQAKGWMKLVVQGVKRGEEEEISTGLAATLAFMHGAHEAFRFSHCIQGKTEQQAAQAKR